MKTILVVDDDERISAAVAIRLRAAGYQAVTASDGVKGLELAIEHQVSLIITDIWMTVGNGFSLAHRLRTALPRVPVLFMTASKRPGLREMAAQTGAAGFFEKPFDMQAMMAAVEICVGPGGEAPSGSVDTTELAASAVNSESQADSPDSPDEEPAEPVVPPPIEFRLVESAPLPPAAPVVNESASPPPAESPVVQTPPPLPPSVPVKPELKSSPVPRSVPSDLESSPVPIASSTGPAPLLEPLPSPLAESAEKTPLAAPAPPVEELEPQSSGSPAPQVASGEPPEAPEPPPADDSPAASREPATQVIKTLPSADRVGPRRILVADADQQVAKDLGDQFRDLGHEVWLAHDPAGTVERVLECQPNLAVIDLAMPGSSGFTVARQVQTLASDPVAVIFTTGKKRVEYRKLAKQLGAAGLFEKPYDTEDLLHAAFTALEKSAPLAA